MKVSELIVLLGTFNPEATIFVSADLYDYEELIRIGVGNAESTAGKDAGGPGLFEPSHSGIPAIFLTNEYIEISK